MTAARTTSGGYNEQNSRLLHSPPAHACRQRHRIRANGADEDGDSAKGKVLTDAKGMTLYTFDKDMGGKSACNGPCATNWPPLRPRRRRQAGGRLHDHHPRRRRQAVGLQGQAALHLEERPKAGDITGDGFLNNIWHIAKP